MRKVQMDFMSVFDLVHSGRGILSPPPAPLEVIVLMQRIAALVIGLGVQAPPRLAAIFLSH